jgi:hypothetical protein
MGIVASAIASFNNSALALPGFFWTSVMMTPVFFIVWKMSAEILAIFFPVKKSRDYNFAFIAEALIAIWLVFGHGNWETLRDGVGFLPYLLSAVLFLVARDATARLWEQNPRMPKWWRTSFDGATRRWLKIGALLVFVAILGLSTVQEFRFIALQISGCLFGIAAGYFGRKASPPLNYMVFVMIFLTVGITMQPEYFRFGQLGRLTFLHLAAVAGIVKIGALIFALRNFAPAGFIKDNHYQYIKWFMRLGTLLVFILFVMTEAVPALLAFGLGVLATAWFAVKHLPKGTDVFVLSGNLWAAMLCLFGSITVMPTLTVIGILCWKSNGTRAFWQKVSSSFR